MVRVTRVDADDYFVVLADGVQRIGEVAANLIRIIDSQGSREIPSVSPDAVGEVPVVDSLPVSTFPRQAGTTIGRGRQWCAVRTVAAEPAEDRSLVRRLTAGDLESDRRWPRPTAKDPTLTASWCRQDEARMCVRRLSPVAATTSVRCIW